MEVKDAFLPVTHSWRCRQAGQRLLTKQGVVGKELAHSAQALATYPGQSASGLVTHVGIDMSVCLNIDPPKSCTNHAPTALDTAQVGIEEVSQIPQDQREECVPAGGQLKALSANTEQ